MAGASIREINRGVSAGGGKGIKLRGSELEEERNKTHPRAKKALRRRKKTHFGVNVCGMERDCGIFHALAAKIPFRHGGRKKGRKSERQEKMCGSDEKIEKRA